MGGVVRRGFFLEIQQFPQDTGSAPGHAVYRYINARGTEDEVVINFVYNAETGKLDAWHVKSPSNKFAMTPVLDGQLGLDVTFPHLPDVVFQFTLSRDEEAVVYDYDSHAPILYLEELSTIKY